MNHLKIYKKIALGLLFFISFVMRADAQACSTSNEVTITVVNDPTISITGTTTICSGGTATLTATTAGGTGTCTIQWQSSPDGSTGWANISGANGTTYAPTSLTTTTYYRATYSCTGLACDAATSNTQVITVNADLTIQTQPQPIVECVGGTLSMNVVANASTGTGTLSYLWEQSANGTTGWTTATGSTNSSTYTPPSATAGTIYYRVTISATGNGCDPVVSTNAKVDIIPDLTIQTQPSPIVECVGGTTTMSVVLTAGTGTGTISYSWEQSADGSTGWAAATGGTNSATYTPPSSTAGTMYYRVTASATGNGCGSVTSNNAKVDIIPDLTIQTQPSPITECVGGTLSMSVVLTAGTGTGTISYSWEQSTTGTGGWSAATGGTNSTTYTPPSTTAGTMYYRVTASATGDGCGSVTSNSTKVDIISDLTIQTQPTPIVECVGGTTSMSVVVTSGTGTGTISYSWEQSTTGTGGWSAATGGTNAATYTPPSTTAGTMYYRVIVSSTGNGCGSVTSNSTKVDIIPDLTIQTQPSPIVECVGGTTTMSVVLTAGTGTGTISYSWEQSTTGTGGWSAATGGTNSATYTPPSTTAGTMYYRVTASATGDGCGSVTSNSTKVDIIPDLTIQTQPSPITECVGGTLSMSVVLTAGTGTGTISYTWEQSTTGTGGWSAATGGTNSTTYTPPSTTAGTMYYRVTASATGDGCGSVTSNSTKVDIISDLTIQTQPTPIVECVGGTTSMSVVVTSGTGTGTISYSWEQSTTGTGGWSAATGGTNAATYTPPSTTAGTMYYRVTVSSTGNGCGSVTSNSTKVDIIPDLTIQTQPSPIVECVGGTTTMNVVLTAGTGTGTISYNWEQSTTGTGGWSAATGGTNSATYTPLSTTAGTMYYRVTASATGDGCGSVTSNSTKVDIIPDLTIQTQPSPISECVGGTTSMSVVLTAGTGTGTISYSWEQSTTGTGGWSAATGGTNSTTYTPPSTTAGTMYYRVIASATGDGCGSVTSNSTKVDIISDIVITAQPQNITECLDGLLALSVTTTGGIGTTYQWEVSTTGTGGWSPVASATASSYTPPSTAAGTLYYRVVVSSASNGCGSQTSNSATVVIVPKPSVTVTTPNQIVCIGAVLTMNATPSGGTGTCGIQWQNSTDGGTTWNPISGATSNSYVTPPLGANTKYRATFSCDGNGCCN